MSFPSVTFPFILLWQERKEERARLNHATSKHHYTFREQCAWLFLLQQLFRHFHFLVPARLRPRCCEGLSPVHPGVSCSLFPSLPPTLSSCVPAFARSGSSVAMQACLLSKLPERNVGRQVAVCCQHVYSRLGLWCQVPVWISFGCQGILFRLLQLIHALLQG